jgi:hypothetical protein
LLSQHFRMIVHLEQTVTAFEAQIEAAVEPFRPRSRTWARYVFATVALIFLCASPVSAEIWCGYGPDSPTLDHPCWKDNDRLDRAVANFKAERQWEKIPGVTGVGWGINIHGSFFEAIQVFVNPPSMLPSVAAQVPTSIDGVPILVIPPETFEMGGTGSSSCKSGQSNDPAYSPILGEYGKQWDELPGVMSMGSPCKDNCCDFSKVEVTVQAPLIDSVKNHIPASINGVPILIVPFRQ